LNVAILNIAANPHPDGIYFQIFSQVSRYLVRARGTDFAKITKPKRKNDRIFEGRILIWTEIDMKGTWLDLENEDELSPNIKQQISIPSNAKPNYRTFNYVFDVKRHKLYFETKNEFGEIFGPTTAMRYFSRLFSQEILGPKGPDVEVSIIPDESALSSVLALPGLRTLTIRVVRPNGDTASGPGIRRVFEKMEQERIRLLEQTIVKASAAKAIIPDDGTRNLALAAVENGYVRGEGRARDGKKLFAATDDRPKIIQIDQDSGDNFTTRLVAAVPNLQ
jgi:hypothetical protein